MRSAFFPGVLYAVGKMLDRINPAGVSGNYPARVADMRIDGVSSGGGITKLIENNCLPGSVIGNKTDFGSVFPGSSPGRAASFFRGRFWQPDQTARTNE